MTTFYVSAAGNDGNDGQSEASAWRTVSKVRSALSSGLVVRGDSVLFRRGDLFYGSNVAPPATAATAGPRLVFGSYGAGPRPIVDAGKLLTKATSWTLHATGVWKHRLDATALASGDFTGNVENSSTNVGFLKVDGVIHGMKRWALAELVDPWDFYADGSYVYVRATANPTTLATTIVAAAAGDAFTLANSMAIYGLHIRNTGSHGIQGTAINFEVIGNEVEDVGGSALTGTTRYGNGVEVWIGSADGRVEHNDIHGCYDVGYTMQGTTTNAGAGNKWQRVHARHNRFWNNNQDFEIWSQIGDPAHVGSGNPGGHIACSFEDNECVNAGRSWAAAVRPDRPKGTTFLMYELQLPVDISVRRNVVYDPADSVIYSVYEQSAGEPGAPPNPGWAFDDNDVYLRPGVPIVFNRTWTIDTVDGFRTTYGYQRSGRFYRLTDPTASVQSATAYLASVAGATRAATSSSAKAIGENAGATKSQAAALETATRTTVVTPINQSTDPNKWAKVATFRSVSSFGRVDWVAAVMTGGDSTIGRDAWGALSVQFVPPQNTAAGSAPSLRLRLHPWGAWSESVDFMRASDFIAVVEQATTPDGSGNGTWTVGLYVRFRDSYSAVSVSQLNLVTSNGLASFALEAAPVILSALPAGTQVAASYTAGARPTTGAAAPTITPEYVGQEFIDTTAKKVYKATGIASAADWVALN